MLEGLEISIITLSELLEEKKVFRIDSTFYNKEAVALDKQLKERSHFYLPEELVVSGPFGSSLKSESYLSAGIPFIRIENIKSGFVISKEKMVYISPEDNDRLKSSQLKSNDLILSKVGNTIGYYARVDDEIGVCNISENNIGIKLGGFSLEEKHYILAFLNSKYGNKLTVRRVSGNAQPKLNVYDVSEIPIPRLGSSLMHCISQLIVLSTEKKKQSESLYTQSKNLFLRELGFENWQHNEDNISVKTLRKSFFFSGRLDAEYYQSKYDVFFEKLERLETKRLSHIVNIEKSIEPGSDYYQTDGIPFIRVADITKYGITKPAIYLDKNIFRDAIRPKMNTILMSKDGSVGIAYKVEKDEDIITSGAILHLTIKDEGVLPDYLTLVINSEAVQMQAERDAGGSIIQHWKPSEIENVVIPILPIDEQIKISEMVQESFRLRNESKRLLEVAKKAVEIAISESEEVALMYLKENENG